MKKNITVNIAYTNFIIKSRKIFEEMVAKDTTPERQVKLVDKLSYNDYLQTKQEFESLGARIGGSDATYAVDCLEEIEVFLAFRVRDVERKLGKNKPANKDAQQDADKNTGKNINKDISPEK